MENEVPIEITILIPVYNEEAAIGGVISAINGVMAPLQRSYEILVVDDCSTDDTGRIAAEAGARVFRHIFNQGSGASRRSGVRQARGEIIVMLDGDGTYEPATIPEMLQWFPEYDQVNGARTSEKGSLRLLRMPAKWFIKKLAEYLSGRRIPDLNTGLKAFKRSIMMHYLWLLPDGFSCVTTMTLAFLTNNHAVKYVPTPYYTRIGKSKFHPVKDTARYISTVVRMCAYFRPLRVFGPVASLLIIIGVLRLVLAPLSGSEHPSGTVSTILICTGLMVGAIGAALDVLVSQRRDIG
jgi:glycosyltransferase involved in cell wall biosynthesis